MNCITFELRGDHISLDHLLKACGLANSGGQAKLMIADGMVEVNGKLELRKTAKIRAGEWVQIGTTRINCIGQNFI